MTFKSFFRTNWGIPFVALYFTLLAFSGIELVRGSVSLANDILTYSFYSLIIAAFLQTASYLKYEEGEPRSEPLPTKQKKLFQSKILNVILLVLIIVMVIIASLLYYSPGMPLSGSTSRSSSQTSKLTASVNFERIVPGPNGSTVITFGITNSGGTSPYNFTAQWSDGLSQSNDIGIFTRSILQNETVPESATVTVKSSNGEIATIQVQFQTFANSATSTVNTITTNTSSTSSSADSMSGRYETINFSETGLFSGMRWSVTLNNKTANSTSNSILFSVTPGQYNYTISYPYTPNFTVVYFPSPKTGVMLVNSSDVHVRVTYALVHVGIPPQGLLTQVGVPKLVNINSTPTIVINYQNNFVAQIQATIVVNITNNNTGVVAGLYSSAISPTAEGNVTALIPLTALGPGVYVANITVQSATGTEISKSVNMTISLPMS